MKKLGAKFWIGSDAKNRSMKEFTGSGALGIPQFYVIDAKGVVVGDTIPSDHEIEKLLAAVEPEIKLERSLHKSLAVAEAAFRGGAFGHAAKVAGALAKHEDPVVVKDVAYLRAQITKFDAARQKSRAEDLEGLNAGATYGKLLEWKYDFAGLPHGMWAAAELEKFKKDRAKMAERSFKNWRPAWKKLEKVLEREAKAYKSDYERKRVKQLYDKLVADDERSEPGRIAKRRVRAWKRMR